MTCPNVNSCQEMSRCIALLCYGKFLHTIIAGWDDTECQRVYESIYHHMCMEKQVRTVVSNKPGKWQLNCSIFYAKKTLII